jgi:adenylate cyclase
VVAHEPTNDELWRDLLTDHYSPTLHMRRRYRHYPGNPRCKQCLVPLGGPVHPIVRLITKKSPSRKNPNFCDTCETFAETHPGGAEIELTMLFADVRGSTRLAEGTGPAEFHRLIARFHKEAGKAVIDHDGLLDRIVGDEVVGLFLPMLADHARQAVQAAIDLLEATGHREEDGPWAPVGVGIHTGVAYVGTVGMGHERDFTALGDPVNVTARLASVAAAGELLISEDAYRHAGLEPGATESRRLELKGKTEPIDVRVVRVAPATAAAEAVTA